MGKEKKFHQTIKENENDIDSAFTALQITIALAAACSVFASLGVIMYFLSR